jgi:cytochrome P450
VEQYGDIAILQVGSRRVVLLNRPEYVEQVLVSQHKTFVKGSGMPLRGALLGNGLLTSEGDFWLRQRRLAQPAFHRARIEAYGRVMTEYTQRFLESWHDGDAFDLHAQLMHLTLQIVAKTLFDADVTDDAEDIGQAMHVAQEHFMVRRQMLFRLSPNLPTPGNRRFTRAVERLDRTIYRIIDERRASGQDTGDLLSMLLQAQDEDGTGMTDQQLRDEVMTLFLAGHETTSIALSWALYLVTMHPEVETRLLDEIAAVTGGRAPRVEDRPNLRYTEAVVNEAMRLYPPAWRTARLTVHDTTIGGYLIPAGSLVMISQWTLHRDARYFEDPLEFRPERWLDGLEKRLPRFAFFPFGGGRRICIGAPFAMMEAVLLLASIVQRYQFTVKRGHRMTPLPAITLRPRYGLPVIAHRR